MRRGLAAALLVALLGSGVAAAAYGSGVWDQLTTDRAVRGCEVYIKATLRSPSSYRRVYAHLRGDMVEIEYDAQNGFGATIRGAQACQYSFYGQRFELQAPADASIEDRPLFLHAIVAATLAGLNYIPADRTALRPSPFDQDVADCVEKIMHDQNLILMPERHDLSVLESVDAASGRPATDLIVRADAIAPGFPRQVQCQRDDDGSVSAHIRRQ